MNMLKGARASAGQHYRRFFGRGQAEKEKARLLGYLATLPITRDSPFDIETKLVRSLELERAPVLDIGANEIEARHHRFPIEDLFARFADDDYRSYFVRRERFGLREVSTFDVRRDQAPEILEAKDCARYQNNCFFVHKTREDAFTSAARKFPEAERLRSSVP